MRIQNETMLSSVLRGLDEKKGAWPDIAKASGVPYQTLTKIACRIVADPRVSTVQALHDYFTGFPEQPASSDSAQVAH